LIKCTIKGITLDTCEGHGGDDYDIVVSPSKLSLDVRRILEDGLKVYMTVRIGFLKTFGVHKFMLATQSPVFRVQLCSSMVESRRRNMIIDN
jgi:hypothetical protein